MDSSWIVLALIVVPVLGSLCALPFRKSRLVALPVLATSAAMIVLSLALLLDFETQHIKVLTIDESALGPANLAIVALDFALMLFFLYTGLRLRSTLTVVFSLLQIMPIAALELGGFGDGISPALAVDYLAVVMGLVISIIGSIICVYGVKYMEDDGGKARFHAAMLLFLGAMNGAVFANNLLWLFFFWEVTTLCSFLLIGHERTKEADESALRALVYTLGGGVSLAFGLVLVQRYYGSLSVAAVLDEGALGGLALMPLALLAVAAFTKAALVPFQNWLLGAMVAPTPVSALLHSSTMVKLGVYFLLRMSPSFAGTEELAWPIAFIGGISFLATSVLAIAESNSKRVLAYSTIGNLGLITMCAGIGTPLAISAAIILVLFHAVSKALLFMAVGVAKKRIRSLEIDDMIGLRDKMPFVAFAMAVGVFTILLPPFGMFASKWLVTEAALSLPLLTFLLACGFAATVVYYSKWLGRILSTGATAERLSPTKEAMSRYYRYTLGGLALGAIALSFLIGPVIRYLVDPYLIFAYDSTSGGSDFSLLTSFGTFPMLILLVVVGLMFLLVALLERPKSHEIASPYMCGENYEFQAGGFYVMSRLDQRRTTIIASIAAVVVLGILVLGPVFSEVSLRL
jgi:ech hydrogenase subunit A